MDEFEFVNPLDSLKGTFYIFFDEGMPRRDTIVNCTVSMHGEMLFLVSEDGSIYNFKNIFRMEKITDEN